MECKRPPLVLAIGSRGGYAAFQRIVNNVDPAASRRGAIYLAEHLDMYYAEPIERPFFEDALGDAQTRGNGRRIREVAEGMRLECGGFYLQQGIYENHRNGERIFVLEGDGGEGVRFVSRPADPVMMGLSYSTISAIDAGYGKGIMHGKDIMLVCLSGCGYDGASALERVGKANGIPSVLIQDPENAKERHMPDAMIEEAKRLGIPRMVLLPEEIGGEINRFLEQAGAQYNGVRENGMAVMV
jgi:chemotaxis response regulator CheB